MKTDESIYRTLLESAAEGIVIVDKDGVIVLANAMAEILFGYPKAELVGQKVEILVPERLRGVHVQHREAYVENVRNRPMGSGLALVGRRKDGSEFPIAVSLSYAGAGDDLRVMAAISDITELKQAEEERAKVMAERIRQLEAELQSLERMGSNPATATTAASFGAGALREGFPDVFTQYVAEFGEIMDLALEQDSYKVEHNLAEKLRAMAEKLGFLRGGPRDVIDIYSTALRVRTVNVLNAKAQVYVDEGRLIALEIMGYLVSFYRNYAGMGGKNALSRNYPKPPAAEEERNE